MSYKNNWLKSLSESYNTNNRGQVNLSEELASQVALNEQLVDLVVALCEELGVDPQDLLEDVFDAKGEEATQRSLGKLADRATLDADSRHVSNRVANASMRRYGKAATKADNREASKTIYTAKGGRVVKKVVKKK